MTGHTISWEEGGAKGPTGTDEPRPGLFAARVRQFWSTEVETGSLIALLIAFLCLNNVLLWRFLDFARSWIYALPAAAALLSCLAFRRMMREGPRKGPTVGLLLTCAALSLVVFLLGGQGGLFYANVDWQVRDAVLRDMVVYPWPFAYTARGTDEVLRAPIGMFLVPALVGKIGGLRAANLSLLLQNTAFLAMILSIAATFFRTNRQRLLAFTVFILFSGMDLLGAVIMRVARGIAPGDHLEPWAYGLQFSSHLTQAFWVPQHALAGWFGALLFILWRIGRAPAGVVGVSVPLLALWSPLSAIGIAPFAAYAGVRAVAKGTIGWVEIVASSALTMLALPALFYLGAAANSVGGYIGSIDFQLYALQQFAEVLPYVGLLFLVSFRPRLGLSTLVLSTVCLVTVPFIRVGASVDFMMRASIPALAILALLVADALVQAKKRVSSTPKRLGYVALLAVLTIGAVTPIMELRRALILRPTPETRCNLLDASEQIEGLVRSGPSTYVASVLALPDWMRPGELARADSEPGKRCWSRSWRTAR